MRRGPRRVPQETSRDPRLTLENLKNDPSLKFTDAGRSVLRWLCSHAIEGDGWRAVLDYIPPHCAEVVAELARYSADSWQEFARQLEQRNYIAG